MIPRVYRFQRRSRRDLPFDQLRTGWKVDQLLEIADIYRYNTRNCSNKERELLFHECCCSNTDENIPTGGDEERIRASHCRHTTQGLGAVPTMARYPSDPKRLSIAIVEGPPPPLCARPEDQVALRIFSVEGEGADV